MAAVSINPAASVSNASTAGLTLPADVQAEMSILGSMLVAPYSAETALDLLAPEDFYRREHQRIFAAMVALSSRGETIEPMSVSSELARARGEEFLPANYLQDLVRASVSRGNVAGQARFVQEHSTRRKLIQYAHQLATQSRDTEMSLTDLVAFAEGSVLDATQSQCGEDTAASIPSLLDAVFAGIEARGQQAGIPGVSSGMPEWDARTLGLKRKNLYILAGRPAMGKTAAACGMMISAATQGKRVAFFSLEMSKEELTERCLSSVGRVSLQDIGRGRLSSEQHRCLNAAKKLLSKWQVHIDEQPSLTLGQIVSRSRRIRSEMGGLDLVIVDYIGLVKPDTNRRSANRAEEVSHIANGLKAAAKQLDVPVVALAQINRGVESRENKRPQLSDLKESGGIEEAADVVTGIYRPLYYNPIEAMPADDGEPAEWLILKGRNVRTGVVKVVYHGHYTRFDSAPDSDGGEL